MSADIRIEAPTDAQGPLCDHIWGEWDYTHTFGPYKKRYCVCGAFEARRIDREVLP